MTTEEEGASGGVPTDHDHRPHDIVIRGILTPVIVTFHVVDTAWDAIVVQGDSHEVLQHPKGVPRHRDLGVEVDHGTTADQSALPVSRRLRDEETAGRDHDRPETSIDVDQFAAKEEGNVMYQTEDHGLCLQTANLLCPSGGDTLHLEAGR